MSGLRYEEGTTVYVAPQFHSWSAIKSAADDCTITLNGTEAVGFSLVFEDYETCKREFPDYEPIELVVLSNPAPEEAS